MWCNKSISLEITSIFCKDCQNEMAIFEKVTKNLCFLTDALSRFEFPSIGIWKWEAGAVKYLYILHMKYIAYNTSAYGP